jgi:MerT mercuric transport protein.
MSTQNTSNAGTNWSLGAALGAAVGASACCTIPLALVSLGVGGAWIGSLTALAPYRWIFVTLAVAASATPGTTSGD